MTRYAILAFAALSTLALQTHAGFIVNFEQEGSNVVATGNGSINTAGLTPNQMEVALPASAQIAAISSFVVVGGELGLALYNANNFTGPTSFGSGSTSIASSGTGKMAGVFGNEQWIYLPNSYISGSSLSDSATWTGTTYSSLGLTPGTYTWNWGSGSTADFFEVQIAGVTEPSSFILFGVVAAFGFIAYRWRAASVPA
jgi:hypothetical protein